MDRYNTAVVLGLGVSGRAAAELLMGEGCRVLAADQADHALVQQTASQLERLGGEVHLGGSPLPERDYDVCIVSPGVRPGSEWIRPLIERGIPILSELELGWSRRRCPLLAITGSNGKSTMVEWCVAAMELAGLQAVKCGNCGPPITAVVKNGLHPDWLVAEVSSFQLEMAKQFQPDVALLLNLQPNHLDRHGTFESYMRAKARIFHLMTPSQTAVVPASLKAQMEEVSGGYPTWVTFGTEPDSDFRVSEGCVYHAGFKVGDLNGTLFDNPVMQLNGSAGLAAMEACSVTAGTALVAATTFSPLPHRFETVANRDGVLFIDDSKATNLSATKAALQMCSPPVRLIAGGLAKEKDFASLKEVLAQTTASVYLIGNAAGDLYRAWSDVVPCALCDTLDAAVQKAASDAQAGDTVLLSPGCASFDQFRSFEERGDHFASFVSKLNWEAAS
ncbi:MAG: UDP-N-acetylmuramoyl-L-alanine--D-glutamate ligase [Verrucomicrobia bacterium]|nr:UDP-N-acetylmuramoyl-L-alanine--D-glutamate ligase [Verrucomicrobiota bacterium]